MSKYLRNKKATFNYEIVDTMSAGIQLQGFEVKAIKKNIGGSLEGSYVIIKNGEAFLVGAHIPEYQSGNTPSGYDSRRPRKLLLTKKELNEIQRSKESKGLTVVPLSLYSKGRYIKVDIALARGKKKHDKRNTIKKRDVQRDIDREIKYR
ncbi:MAG: SsrA-binding protein SmpB [Candidatus Pacebacteria bacterium]|nr:SsrA-binding protein SmpB [Candidatus Paceibacterota bacterium]